MKACSILSLSPTVLLNQGKETSLATTKPRKKDVVSLPADMKAKSTSKLQGCLGADED